MHIVHVVARCCNMLAAPLRPALVRPLLCGKYHPLLPPAQCTLLLGCLAQRSGALATQPPLRDLAAAAADDGCRPTLLSPRPAHFHRMLPSCTCLPCAAILRASGSVSGV